MNAQLTTSISFLDPLSRFILVPWSFLHLQLYLNYSQSLAISNYGVMMTFFMIGRNFGKNIHLYRRPSFSKELAYSSVILLGLCFLLLGITSRISIICMCYLGIGLAGGIIRSSCFKDEDDLQPMSQTSNALNSTIPLRHYFDVAILSLIFAPLFVVWTYNSAVTSRYPSLVLCLIVSGLCVLILALLFNCNVGGVSPGGSSWWRVQSAASKTSDSIRGIGNRVDSTITAPVPKAALHVDVHQLEPPAAFMKMARGDKAAAQAKYHKTLIWRHENGVDDIMNSRQVAFASFLWRSSST